MSFNAFYTAFLSFEWKLKVKVPAFLLIKPDGTANIVLFGVDLPTLFLINSRDKVNQVRIMCFFRLSDFITSNHCSLVFLFVCFQRAE